MNLVTLTNPQSQVAEAYRTLRTNLYFASLESPLKTIAITTPSSEDEKSAVVANLAVVFAQAEKKVIAVDADLRHPALHNLFGVPNNHGLADLLTRADADAHPTLVDSGVTGLQLLTSGLLTSNPLDALNSHRMTAAVETLSAMADIVLFDTPPMLGVSDTAILGSLVDGVLLVVQAGKTRREQAQLARDLLSRAHARLLGAVMVNSPRGRGMA